MVENKKENPKGYLTENPNQVSSNPLVPQITKLSHLSKLARDWLLPKLEAGPASPAALGVLKET